MLCCRIWDYGAVAEISIGIEARVEIIKPEMETEIPSY
jgi:hypothetical protein